MKTLKEQNSKSVWFFAISNALVFYALAIAPRVEFAEFNWEKLISAQGIWLSAVPIVLFVIQGLLTSNQKASIVFWRGKTALPGHRAFSHHILKDSRINKEELERRYGGFPKDPDKQNSLWYKMYKKHGEIPSVKKSHKDFLLGRELTPISALFLVFGGTSGLFLIPTPTKYYYLLLLALQYLLLSYVTQNYGRRFVRNVLATESAEE